MTDPGDPAAEGLRLPSPDDAERWEALVPGSAQQILETMQALALLKIQTANAEEADRNAERGLAALSLLIATIIALILIIAAIVFLAAGNNIAGGLLLGVPATGVAVSFIPKAIAGRKKDD